MNPVQEAILAHQGKMAGEGTCVQWCEEDILGSPTEEFTEYVNEKAGASVIRREWAALNSKNKGKVLSGQLGLSLGGLPCAGSYSYRDEFIPGGWRTVLSTFLSVYQLIQARNDHAEQKRSFDKADQELEDLMNVAIERADGDLNKPLSMLTDDFYKDVG